MGDVVNLDCVTKLDLSPNRVLDGARDNLEDAVIIGWTKEGDFYFSSSKANGAEVLWLLEKAKKYLLEIDDE